MSKSKKKFNSPIAELPEPEIINIDDILNDYITGTIDLICVLGPTASGKTKYAVSLAKEINKRAKDLSNEGVRSICGAEIISADSRQVYVGMDIGSGKDLDEYDDITYHLIDIKPAGYKYNIYEYQQDFEKTYADLVSRNVVPILCGGSGLYIKAAVEAYFNDNKPLNVYYIGTLVSREERNAKIDSRLDARLQEGMIEEIEKLLHSGIKPEDLIYYGLEYKFVTQYVIGEISFDEMKKSLATAIHQFAKRQMTWFRGLEKKGNIIHWVENKKD